MNLTAFAVNRWQITLVAFLLTALLGINAFIGIPRSVDPHFPFTNVIVTVVLPGADAATIEETVAKPIEDVLQGLDNIEEIRSTSSDGVVVVVVGFLHGTDADQSLDRTIREVSAIRSSLPPGIVRINYRRPRTTEAAVLQLALVSEAASWRRMEKYAADIRDRINVTPGVRETTISGLAQPEVRVSIDAGKLAQVRLSPVAVSAAISASGQELPAGAVQSGARRFNVDSGGAFRSLSAVEGVPLRAGNGQVLRVGDVAKVGWAEAEQLHITRYNGTRALFISVKQKDNVSATRLRDALVATVADIRPTLPPDLKLELGFDQSRDIERRLGELARDFAIALALVLITLLPLGTRASLVVMVSIPLSLAMGVFMLSIFGYTLNQISITGFIISLGLLVDDSIVVTENIERHLRMGEAPTEAAIKGTREITAAVLGSTGVLMFAFLPLANIPEGSGDFVRGLPMAVLFTVGASLIVSLTVVPFLASKFLSPKPDPHGNRFLQAINGAIERFYQPLLHRALDNPWTTFVGATIGCGAMLATIPLLGLSLFPGSDSPYFIVRVEAPEGSSIATTDKAVRFVSTELAKEPLVVSRMENVGRGNPQIFYNNLQRENDTRYGEIFVTMSEFKPGEGPQFLETLRTKFNAYPDARIIVKQFENGPPVEAPVAVRFLGPDLAVLKSLSANTAQLMASVEGTRDIEDPLAVDRIDLDLGLDDAKTSLLSVAPDAVRRTVRLALSGENASSFRDNEGDSYPVTVRLPMDQRQPVSALGAIYVPSLDGSAVQLSQLATPTLQSVPSEIRRFKLERMVTVTTNVAPSYLASRINTQVLEKLAATKLPAGYRYEVGGAAEASAKSVGRLGGVLIFAVFGIFGVLVAEFGRFRDVAVVAGVVPLGIVGGIAALLITGNTLSFLALIGFIALIGIEIKNSILLVDFTTQLRDRGLALRDAIEKAGEIRFLPVLLTSVTAIGGLLPLALSGAPLYAPLAWVIIGGLISSTLLSRIVTPVMYLLIARGGEPKSMPSVPTLSV